MWVFSYRINCNWSLMRNSIIVIHTNTMPFTYSYFSFFRATPVAYRDSQARGQMELQLLAHATATAMRDPRCACDLHHSSRQRRILNPLSKVRDRTCVLMDASWIHFRWATMGNLEGLANLEVVISFYFFCFMDNPYFFFFLGLFPRAPSSADVKISHSLGESRRAAK